jgi:hypothetical protein
MSLDPLMLLCATGLIAIVFARAIFEKTSEWPVYLGIMRDYRLTPAPLVPAIAAALLALEITTAACLLWPPARIYGAALACGLLALYALAMSLALAAGRTQIDCGCGGDGQQVSWALVGRNVVLIAVAALPFAPAAPRAFGALDYFAAACAIVIGWLALAASEKAIDNAAAVRRLRSESFL